MSIYKDVANLIKKSEKIVVFTGAGISTNSGIPDFRSSDGLYNSMDYDLPYPEAIFDLDYFRDNPEPFFNLARGMFQSYPRPTKCHDFLADLEEKGKVSLLVTQNSDMLHHYAGSIKVIECHGTFSSGHCLSCNEQFQFSYYEELIVDGFIPKCECGGVIKPDVTFFGEEIPDEFYNILSKPPEADLVLILGTSLNVMPTSKFPLELAEKIPSILVNLEPTQWDSEITYVINEDLDFFSEKIRELLGPEYEI